MGNLLRRLVPLACLAVAALGLGCGSDAGASADLADDADDAEAAQTTATGLLTVHGASSQSCTTSSVRGLADQLVHEMMCLRPNLLSEVSPSNNIAFEPEVFPYLQTAAARALERGVARYGKPITLTSALRTLPQQYLLRRWDARNRCGVRVAAPVGDSNHEPGLAVDIKLLTAAENRKLRAALATDGFAWIGSFDAVHFDYKDATVTEEVGRLSVVAFKRLWNRNNPGAVFVEDETYDAKVEAKLKVSPAGGFAVGASCESTP